MKKIDFSVVKGKWYDYKDNVKFLIRPWSLFTIKNPKEEVSQAEYTFNIFNYVVTDWEGIYDENENPIECSEVNKKLVFEYDTEMANWIVDKAMNLRSLIISEKELQNLS